MMRYEVYKMEQRSYGDENRVFMSCKYELGFALHPIRRHMDTGKKTK